MDNSKSRQSRTFVSAAVLVGSGCLLGYCLSQTGRYISRRQRLQAESPPSSNSTPNPVPPSSPSRPNIKIQIDPSSSTSFTSSEEEDYEVSQYALSRQFQRHSFSDMTVLTPSSRIEQQRVIDASSGSLSYSSSSSLSSSINSFSKPSVSSSTKPSMNPKNESTQRCWLSSHTDRNAWGHFESDNEEGTLTKVAPAIVRSNSGSRKPKRRTTFSDGNGGGDSYSTPPTHEDADGPSVSSSSSSLDDTLLNNNNVEKESRPPTIRALYNARFMPSKVIIARHGQSEGNINEEIYIHTPDSELHLTALGWEEARCAGRAIFEGKEGGVKRGESVHFIISPYVRTMETFHGMVSNWVDPNCPELLLIKNENERREAWYDKLHELGITWHEDPRIREQDFGNYQDPKSMKKFKHERHRYGAFYYRFPYGESASDVFDRVSTFLDSLWRSFEAQKADNYIIVTHGAAIRVLLTRYFRYSIDQYNRLANPKNCEMVILGHDNSGKLKLNGRVELERKSNIGEEEGGPGGGDDGICGYAFYGSLRTNPVGWCSRMRVVKMSG